MKNITLHFTTWDLVRGRLFILCRIWRRSILGIQYGDGKGWAFRNKVKSEDAL